MHTQTPASPPGDDRRLSSADDSTRCMASAIYLMSHYARRPCPLLAHAIADQLRMLARQGAEDVSQLVQSLAGALLPHWQAMASGNPALIDH